MLSLGQCKTAHSRPLLVSMGQYSFMTTKCQAATVEVVCAEVSPLHASEQLISVFTA